MNEIYKLYNLEYEDQIKNQISFFESLNVNVDILDVLPNHMHETFKKNKLILDSEIEKFDKYNYITSLKSYLSLFDMLRLAKVNVLAYKAITSVETNQTILNNLKSFRPTKGFSSHLEYDLVANVSGRMTIKKGPNILVLPKRCRTIFESRFEEGCLLSLDFVNLEPRLALKLTGKNPPVDIYEEAKSQLDFEIDRSVIKRAIITMLYGGSHESFKNISSTKAVEIFNTMKKYFDMDKLLEISLNIDESGIRRNYYGRPLWNLDENKSNILINNYIQSSAVDVALKYFTSLINLIDLDKCLPVFVIHDAIVFDIQKDYINKFNEIIKKGYDDKDLGNFPVSISQFNKSCE